MATEVGGFFASLKIMTDDASFQRGMSSIAGLANGLGKVTSFVGPLAAIAGVIKGILDLGTKEGQKLITGKFLGMSADEITAWSGAVQEANGNAQAFIGGIQQLESHLVGVTVQGRASDEMFKNLGILLGPNTDFDKFLKQSTSAQVTQIMSAAQARAATDPKGAAKLLQDILGSDAVQLLGSAIIQGKSVSSMYSDARQRIYVSDSSRREAWQGTAGVRVIGDALGNLASASAAKSFQNAADGINDLVKQVQGAQGAFKALSDLLGAVGAGFLNFGVLLGTLIITPLIAIGDLMAGKPGQAVKDLQSGLKTLMDALSIPQVAAQVGGAAKSGGFSIPGVPTDRQIWDALTRSVDRLTDKLSQAVNRSPRDFSRIYGLEFGLGVAGQAGGR